MLFVLLWVQPVIGYKARASHPDAAPTAAVPTFCLDMAGTDGAGDQNLVSDYDY
jgi:hypothetical protein